MNLRILLTAIFVSMPGSLALAGADKEPLHRRIDRAVLAGFKGPHARLASDEDFLRRVYLDFTGVIPTSKQAREFLQDREPGKRARLIDHLLNGPDYPRRMMEVFTVMFEERRELGDGRDALWEEYLVKSFAAGKAWDQLAREVLAADTKDPNLKAADKFYLDRGGDLHVITNDVGRLFLGRNIECSRCHDHPTVKEFLQRDYYGLYVFLNRSFVFKEGKTSKFAEKAGKGNADFESVFTMQKMVTGAHLPGQKDVAEPDFAKGDEYLDKPNPKGGTPGTPKFSPRTVMAQKMTEHARQSPFVRNAANRLWFIMMGRGVVHPLDMLHAGNPPDQAKLLDVLSEGLLEAKFDVRAFLKEIALSETYQRSSLLPGKTDEIPAGSFAVAQLRPLSPEQLLYSLAQVTGTLQKTFDDAETKLTKAEIETKRKDPVWRMKIMRPAFAKQIGQLANSLGMRKGEPEIDFQASMAGALHLANDRTLLTWLKADPKKVNFLARLETLPSVDAVAEELYLTVLTRMPLAEEKAEMAEHLQRRGTQRSVALQELAWALIASAEFRLNH